MAKPLNKHRALCVYEAQGFMARFYGWHRFKYTQQALFFRQCNSVHSLGLDQALWVLFVDRQFRALGGWRYLAPHRWLYQRGAWGALEVAAATTPAALQQWQQALVCKRFKHYVWRWPDRIQIHCDK